MKKKRFFFTLQVEHQQLATRVLVGPVAEGQHGFLQQVGGNDFVPVVVVELPEFPGDALLYGEPLSSRMTVEQKHLQKPADAQGHGWIRKGQKLWPLEWTMGGGPHANSCLWSRRYIYNKNVFVFLSSVLI